jgi:hypothetical protein
LKFISCGSFALAGGDCGKAASVRPWRREINRRAGKTAKADGKCGSGVEVSEERLPYGDKRVVIAERKDRPAVYEWQAYPQPGSPEAEVFLGRVMDGLRKKRLARED